MGIDYILHHQSFIWKLVFWLKTSYLISVRRVCFQYKILPEREFPLWTSDKFMTVLSQQWEFLNWQGKIFISA